MTTFLLIRHGETGIEEKRQKPDESLSKNGISQAGKLAKRLKDLPINSFYSSPYKRARQTADCIACVNTSLVVPANDDRLVEIGLWVDPLDLRDDTSKEYQGGLCMLNEAQKRVGELLQELKEKHKGETVTLVCHGNLIRAILGYALKMNLETVVRLKVDLASISILEWVDGGYFRLTLFNDTCHLKN